MKQQFTRTGSTQQSKARGASMPPKYSTKRKKQMPSKPKKINRAYKPIVERVPFGRRRDLSSFYNARRWRKVARLFKQNNPFCIMCDAEGVTGPPEVTDHIRGLGFLLDNGLDPYADEELQSLCHAHHNPKSGSEAHKNKIKRGRG